MGRREFLRLAAGGAVASVAGMLTAAASGTQYVAVLARKFEFSPSQITVTIGRPLTLAVTSVDFAHGFGLPDFGVRQDLVPGRTIAFTITPTKEGRYPFLCDNFCGDGHDRMSGTLVVVAG